MEKFEINIKETSINVDILREHTYKTYAVTKHNDYFTIFNKAKFESCYYFLNNNNIFVEELDLQIKRDIEKLSCTNDGTTTKFLTQSYPHNIFKHAFDSDVIDRWYCCLAGEMLHDQYDHLTPFNAYMESIYKKTQKMTTYPITFELLYQIANQTCKNKKATQVSKLLLQGDSAFFNTEYFVKFRNTEKAQNIEEQIIKYKDTAKMMYKCALNIILRIV